MKIIVCLKEVPDMEAHFKVNAQGTGIEKEGLVFKMNAFDECAIEEALKLKEKFSGSVTLLTLGPETAKQTIRKGLAMGADQAIHIHDPAFEGSDSLVIAKAFAKVLEKTEHDLVLTGVQSEDGVNMQTGVMLAQLLNLPHASLVTKMEISDDKKKATLSRELEGGILENIEVMLPAVFTLQTGINIPRYPTLPGIMKAKKKEIKDFKVTDLGLSEAEVGLKGSHAKTIKLFTPQNTTQAQILEGSEEEAAKKLVQKLKEEAKVL